MPESPKSSPLLKQISLCRHNLLCKVLHMFTLSQKVCPCPCLDQLSVEMDWNFETLVLDRQNFDAQNDLIQEKLCKRVVLTCVSICVSFLSLEAKVDAVFHDEETPLVRVVFEAFEHLGVNLGHGPGLKVSGPALCVHKTVPQLCAHRNGCISKLVQAFSANFAVVAN